MREIYGGDWNDLGDKWNGESETRNEKLPKSVIQISNRPIVTGKQIGRAHV